MTSRARTAERLLGEEISRLRKHRGISQEELGFQAGVHRTYVSQIERGLKSPPGGHSETHAGTQLFGRPACGEH